MNSFSRGESAQKAYRQLENTLETNPPEESISRLEDFLGQYSGFAQAHNDLAVLYYRSGNKLQTLGHYEKAVRLEPANSSFRKNLASFYFVEMGWVDDAILIYTDILANSPNDTEVLAALAIISINLARVSEARTFLTRLLELEPWNNDARRFLAGLDSQPVPASESVAASCPAEKPLPSPADLDDILADLRQTISKIENQGLPGDMHAKAVTLLNRGDEQGAVRELESLVRMHPSFAVAHNDLGVLYLKHGDIQKALHHHEVAAREDSANIAFKKNLAGIYFSELNRTDEAIFLLTDILKGNPNDVETLSGLAQIALSIGRIEEATAFLEKVTELEPWNDGARDLLNEITGKSAFFLAKR